MNHHLAHRESTLSSTFKPSSPHPLPPPVPKGRSVDTLPVPLHIKAHVHTASTLKALYVPDESRVNEVWGAGKWVERWLKRMKADRPKNKQTTRKSNKKGTEKEIKKNIKAGERKEVPNSEILDTLMIIIPLRGHEGLVRTLALFQIESMCSRVGWLTFRIASERPSKSRTTYPPQRRSWGSALFPHEPAS